MADDDAGYPPPLSFSEKLEDFQVDACGVLAIDDDSTLGILTIITRIGHYDFMIDQEIANEFVKQLREFIGGNSNKSDEV